MSFIDDLSIYLSACLPIYVPCRSTSAIMSVQVFLSFDACNTSHVVQETPIRLIILLINVILCLPLAHFPAIFPVIAKYSIFSFLLKLPKNLICLTVIIFISSLRVSAFLNTVSFDNRSNHDILSILLRNQISAASRRSCIALLIVQLSHPYISVDHM